MTHQEALSCGDVRFVCNQRLGYFAGYDIVDLADMGHRAARLAAARDRAQGPRPAPLSNTIATMKHSNWRTTPCP